MHCKRQYKEDCHTHRSLAELDGAWKKVLLNQFHDVLPGSGIGIIYPQAEQYYQEAIESALSVWNKAGDAIFGKKSFHLCSL